MQYVVTLYMHEEIHIGSYNVTIDGAKCWGSWNPPKNKKKLKNSSKKRVETPMKKEHGSQKTGTLVKKVETQRIIIKKIMKSHESKS
jgi:hypothetical protein